MGRAILERTQGDLVEVTAVISDMLMAQKQIMRLALMERLSRGISSSPQSRELARHAYAVQANELDRLGWHLMGVEAANDEQAEPPHAA